MKLHTENRLPAGIAAGVVLVGLIVVLASGGGSPDQLPQVPDTTSPTTESVTVTSADSASPPEGRQVAPLDCFSLLPDDAVEIALGIADLPWEERGTYGRGKGETCVKQIPDDENIYVGLEPGAPGDLAPGAQLIGVTGEPVSGVGDVARWFGGTGAAGGGVGGILSVSQETSFGFLYFRISLGRPDLDSAAQQEVAKSLALAVLPRFPFVDLEEPEPELVTFDWEPVDLSVVGYADNLLVKEEAGEWTRGEGLVATLKLFAGEIDQTEVLRHPDLIDYSGTGVVALAQEYLETGADDEARAEIARLLDSLVPSRQQLEQMAEGALASGLPGLLLAAPVLFVQEGSNACQTYYGTDPPCLVPETSPGLEARWRGWYTVWRPATENAGGWDAARIKATVEALRESIVKYSTLTAMPPVDIVLSVDENNALYSNTILGTVHGGSCRIMVYPNMQGYKEDPYKQVLARDIAYCLIEEAFLKTPPVWWVEGLAMYLGGWVYPDVNLEHRNLPDRLRSLEPNSSLLTRRFTNWVFFEHLHASLDVVGTLNLMSAVNARGVDVLADYWHPFNEQLTDAAIEDIGPKVVFVPYKPPYQDIQITGPKKMTPHPPKFQLARAQMTVQSGKKACVTYKSSGDLTASWRSGYVEAAGADWSTDLPSELTSVSVFLVTATKDGAKLTMDVEKVIDQNKNCDEDEDVNRPKLTFLDLCDWCKDPTAFLDKKPAGLG